ncbi:MAG: Maf family nucleotide pyrophosphatase [Amaricoccus sp.]
MSVPLILASRSPSRAALLKGAGIAFEIMVAGIDETAIKRAMQDEGAPPRDIADTLAEFKARRVAGRVPDRLVLGADQILVCEGRMFDKPADLDQARAHLHELRGKTHELLSAAVIYESGAPVWRHVGRAQLVMRSFTTAFLDDYIAREGVSLLDTVGAYRLEAHGAQLFSRVQGDYFSILGLPLLEVLGFLRSRRICLE